MLRNINCRLLSYRAINIFAKCQYSIESKLKTSRTSDVDFLVDLFQISNYRAQKLVETVKFRTLDRQDLIKSMQQLRSYDIKLEDIQKSPTSILISAGTIATRYNILEECAFNKIVLIHLYRYIMVMNRNISLLKSHGYIDSDVNISKYIIDNITDVKLSMDNDMGEAISLKTLRRRIISLYLSKKLNMSDQDLVRLWKSYSRIHHKSIKSIRSMIDLLKKDLKFPNERIIQHLYLLHGDADNVREILIAAPTLGGIDTHEVFLKHPKIMMSNCESILKINNTVKEFDLPESYTSKCFDIYTLGPSTVADRLNGLRSIKEFDVLKNNPRVIRLVHYQNKALTRLDYLKQIKIKCASLHVLSSNAETFEKYARDGSDKTKGQDVSYYLTKILKKTENEIRSVLSRHPNWCHVPLLDVKKSLDYLQSSGYKNKDILNNLHLILYPIARIEEKLVLIKEERMNIENFSVDSSKLMPSELLGLCLYLIERDFHFTGDGIWSDPAQTTMEANNISNELQPILLTPYHCPSSKSNTKNLGI